MIITITSTLWSITTIDNRAIVQLETSMGTIIIRLFPDEAPNTCKNFLSYVNEGYYNNTIFHRVIDGFIIQGGGFNKDLKAKKTKEPIRNESRQGLSNIKGTVSMALTIDNNSAASQFFFNLANNKDLDYTTQKGKGYTVFAEVIDGERVLEKIQKVRTRRVMYYSELYKRNVPLHDVPEEAIILTKATVLRNNKKVTEKKE
ncbi:MAG: hypothetical protein CMP21_07625 [Rickettsiales bacterium]|nr:hypothetical protein [Rickettsiales bacterium]|tara:strand:- start:8218 stop:8823 length:606 start_codon:yes stop_codon:yes gene_type:complete